MFLGTGTAIVTPFNEDLSVDYISLKKLVKHQIDGGVASIVVLGTTGEAAVIEDDERKQILETVLEEVNGKAKVILGTGTNNTYKTVKYNKIAEEMKVDGVLVVNPYYNKSTQKGLVEHFSYIAERTDLPIIAYNVPSRTAMNILPDTILEIHQKNKNVIAIKEASGDISQIAKICAAKPDTLAVYSGNDDQTLPIMALGAAGVISVFSNVFPKEMVSLTEAMLNNDLDNAVKIHNKYIDFMNLLFIETSPSPAKYILSEMGICKNVLRLPLVKLTAKSEAILKSAYNKLAE